MNNAKTRCAWCLSDELSIRYHDDEWGVPEHDNRKLFEMLILEGAQAGLSWQTILKKREEYRKAFDRFDPVKIARYTPAKIERLLGNPGIVRNRLKILSAVRNAKAFLQVRAEFGSFDAYLGQFRSGRGPGGSYAEAKDIPARTDASDALSRDLTRRGFSFVGSTICYAFMQAVGMVNDHTADCWKYSRPGA